MIPTRSTAAWRRSSKTRRAARHARVCINNNPSCSSLPLLPGSLCSLPLIRLNLRFNGCLSLCLLDFILLAFDGILLSFFLLQGVACFPLILHRSELMTFELNAMG